MATLVVGEEECKNLLSMTKGLVRTFQVAAERNPNIRSLAPEVYTLGNSVVEFVGRRIGTEKSLGDQEVEHMADPQDMNDSTIPNLYSDSDVPDMRYLSVNKDDPYQLQSLSQDSAKLRRMHMAADAYERGRELGRNIAKRFNPHYKG